MITGWEDLPRLDEPAYTLRICPGGEDLGGPRHGRPYLRGRCFCASNGPEQRLDPGLTHLPTQMFKALKAWLPIGQIIRVIEKLYHPLTGQVDILFALEFHELSLVPG